MAKRPRIWDRLAVSTRRRYLSKGKTLGQTPAQVQAHYEAGGNMAVYRGQRQHPGGVSERQWRALKAAAKRARLDEDGDVDVILDSLLAKNLEPSWIRNRLNEKADSRDTWRSDFARQLRRVGQDEGWQPGRNRWHRRLQYADIELYYYH